MCYIMVSKKVNNERDLKIEEKLKSICLGKSEANPDGFFIDYAGASLRTMNKAEAQKTLKTMPFDNAMIHFRFATVGKKTIGNVHGWEQDGFQFLHNGGVETDIEDEEEYYNNMYFSSYKSYKPQQEHADSKLLFQRIVARILEKGVTDKQILKAIKYCVSNSEFWGRAILIDKAHDKAWLFGNWHSYLIENKYIVYSSHDIKDTEPWVIKNHGMAFEYDQDLLPANSIEVKFEGIAKITNFNKPNFFFKLMTEELEDKSLDERVYPVIKTEYLEYNEGKLPDSIQDETEEILDLFDAIPEYQSMNPFDMEVFVDETGTHDQYRICCDNDTCFIYDSHAYKEHVKQRRIETLLDQVGEQQLPLEEAEILAQM